jgi:hypothetical protein
MIRLLRIATVFLLASACRVDDRDEAPQSAAEQSAPAPSVSGSAAYTIAELQALRYLEGDWRGSGYEGGPFYESYRFVNDSTIEMTAWTDSTMTAPRERSEYVLRGGVIRTGSGGRLVSVDENGHHFQSGSATWTFRQISPDRWTAKVGPSTTYTMDRIARR